MKKYQTHSVTQVEELLFDYADRIQNAKTKTEKKELLKYLKAYEKQFNNVSDKHINGKEYPNRMYHSDNKLMDRETIEKLIESVNVPNGKTTTDYLFENEGQIPNYIAPFKEK